jgi:hypothetical protein
LAAREIKCSKRPNEEDDPQNLYGKAFQLNEDSVEEGDPIRPAEIDQRRAER